MASVGLGYTSLQPQIAIQRKKHGRKGQSQYGVDIFGQPEQKERWTGVQTKEKDQLAASSLTEKE